MISLSAIVVSGKNLQYILTNCISTITRLYILHLQIQSSRKLATRARLSTSRYSGSSRHFLSRTPKDARESTYSHFSTNTYLLVSIALSRLRTTIQMRPLLTISSKISNRGLTQLMPLILTLSPSTIMPVTQQLLLDPQLLPLPLSLPLPPPPSPPLPLPLPWHHWTLKHPNDRWNLSRRRMKLNLLSRSPGPGPSPRLNPVPLDPAKSQQQLLWWKRILQRMRAPKLV